jgi:GxxExxY protein
MHFDTDSHAIIGAALEVHRALGPGLLESAYQKCLALELEARGIPFLREVPIPLSFRGVRVDASYRADFICNRSVIVEVKSVQKLEGIHSAQLLTYLKLTKLRVGLLINFNVQRLSSGTVRLVR